MRWSIAGTILVALFFVALKPAYGVQFSKEVQAVLDKKNELLKKNIAENPIVINAVKESNEQHKDVNLSEIQQVDQQWQEAKELNDLMKGLMTNACALLLIEFQETHDGYPEIFLTNDKGLNVCMTNKTSDYYQADEDWWVKSFADAQGHIFYGDIEYDESAMAESIAVYIPIFDPQTKQAIGVIKGVIDITAIKMEL